MGGLDSAAIKAGLVRAGLSSEHIEISPAGLLGYGSDVGPISLVPQAVVGVRSHADVEKTVRFAHENGIAITARGAGSGLPGQSVGAGIVLDMRSLDKMKVLSDHPEGGKVVLVEAGMICTRLNNALKEHGVFLASYPASTDMATVGGMIANNASGANSCKLGTTQHHVMDLHIVLSDGTGLWTSEIQSGKEPWSKIVELVKANAETIEKRFPRVPKNSSGYNVLDIHQKLQAGLPIDWARLFVHSEGTLGVITEAKIRALPLATQKATCIVYFTDLQEACGAIPKIYNLGTSCFDTAFTTNLDLIRKTFPAMGIREDAKVMYLIEFDDVEVKPDPKDPTRRVGTARVMDKQAATELIQRQVEALRKLLETDYPKTAIGFDVALDPARQDLLWQGRRGALNVLYAYDPAKRPLTMIECVVIPRDEQKILDFIRTMERVFSEQGVVAGTHGHAGDCNFHIYLLLNLTLEQDRRRLIEVMTRITEKVTELGGSMSGEHADGRTRGAILPYVFGKELFDLFVQIKEILDPDWILHPGVKIVKDARDKELGKAIEEIVGIEADQSQLNLARFKDYGHLYSGVCSLCSQCSDICPIFHNLRDEFPARTEATPAFKRALAMAADSGNGVEALRNDPVFRKAMDLCLLCGQCTWKCATSASTRDMVAKIRQEHPSKVVAPSIAWLMSRRGLYNGLIKVLGGIQGLWNSRVGRGALAIVPKGILPTSLPAKRYLPHVAKGSIQSRFPDLFNLPATLADVAYFHGCSADLFAEPIVESFVNIARKNGWKVTFPKQQCCGEPFAAAGNEKEYLRLARYNIDQLSAYKYVVAHCPSCLLAFKEIAKEFGRIGDTAYQKKAQDLVAKLYDPATFMVKVIGLDKMVPATHEIKRKVAVHVSCHEKLGHKLSATANSTQALLGRVPGLELVPMKGADGCCGQGGPWGLAGHYDLSVELRQEKIANVVDSQADTVATWCLGCMIQLKDGLKQADSPIQVQHPLELLDEAYGK